MFKNLLLTCSVFLLGLTFSLGQTTITVPILASTDDAEEVGPNGPDNAATNRSAGDVDLESSDLEITDDATWNGPGQIIGLRFLNLSIPQGALITSAHLEFKAETTVSEPASYDINAEATDDALTFEDTPQNISSRQKTDATVVWNETEGWTTDETETSADIASLVQEVVDREGWEEGNAMSFIITGSGLRRTYSFDDGEDAVAPKLVVTYMPVGSLEAQISASTDDAEEVVNPENDNAVGFIDLASSDIELVDDNGWNGDGQYVGLRFSNLDIPQGAPIRNAYIEFTSKYNDESENTSLVFKAQATDNAPTFTDESMNISSRITTNNMVEWNDISPISTVKLALD